MNDQTPKRLGGSLVERAAAHQAFVQRQAAQQAAPAPAAPAPKPRHDIPVFGAVEAPRAPLVRPEPVAAAQPAQEPSARRRVAIDRKKLIALITIEVHSREVIEKLVKQRKDRSRSRSQGLPDHQSEVSLPPTCVAV